MRDDLAAIDPACAQLPLLSADVTDEASLRRIAEASRVVITTVGPYVLYGDALVAACASAGTDYLDLTGEPEFVNTSYVRHHRTALDSGARLIHAAGFDSVPHDLGALFTVEHLPEDVPLTVSGYLRASGTFSGGTFHSAVTAFSRPRQNIAAARERRALESHVRGPLGPRRGWPPAPRPGRRRLGDAAAHDRPADRGPFGPGARALRPGLHATRTTRRCPTCPWRWAERSGVGALFGLAQVPPVRRALLNRIKPGDGPSAEKRAKSWFTVTFVGEGGGERVVTRVSGGDPGYDETAKMLAESALALVLDDLPATAGQVTTATALGDALIDRLRKAGMGFEVLA